MGLWVLQCLILLPGNKESMVQRFYYNVQVEGAVNQVLGGTALQVGIQQEIPSFLRALVEIVDMADHHFPLLPYHHNHCLLETHTGKVWTRSGRCYDDARSTSLGACGLHGSQLSVGGPGAEREPARGEQRVPGHSFAGVVATGPELGLEAETAVIAGGVIDDPGGTPGGGQVVTGSENAAVDIKVLG